MDHNQQVYNNKNIVSEYKSQTKLQPAEETIFHLLELEKSKVLDIGIGAGRTTIHLAPMCKEYVGVDYSEAMIDYCKSAFNFPNASFDVCDARNMSQFKDGEFDVVVFSFNGIDCIPFVDRDMVFKEVHRILKTGGYFVFSSHNVRNLERKYSFRMPRNPLNYFKEKQRLANIKKFNGKIDQYRNRDYFIFYDGAEHFSMQVLYIKPELQIDQLRQNGFHQIQFFNRITGKGVTNFPDYTEPWLYYLCQKKG